MNKETSFGKPKVHQKIVSENKNEWIDKRNVQTNYHF